MRCLVIEDEADTARYICNGLTQAGHTATLVRGGLHLATNENWDVIILDRMLPGGVDGLSIISTIRNLGKTTPLLILSALASLDERVRGLRGGGDDYLTKPFGFSELLARLEAPLRRPVMMTCFAACVDLLPQPHPAGANDRRGAVSASFPDTTDQYLTRSHR